MKRLTPILVRWHDTISDDCWLTEEELDKEVAKGDKHLLCETMGFLWKYDKYALTLVASRFLDGSRFSEKVSIARRAIVSIQPIKLSSLEGG